jgi:hypothetical protein
MFEEAGTEDVKHVEALADLRDQLTRELDATSDVRRRGTLNVATRALSAAIEIQETLIAFERGTQQKRTSRDLDTYSQREEYLKAIMSPIKPAK